MTALMIQPSPAPPVSSEPDRVLNPLRTALRTALRLRSALIFTLTLTPTFAQVLILVVILSVLGGVIVVCALLTLFLVFVRKRGRDRAIRSVPHAAEEEGSPTHEPLSRK